MSYRKEPIGPPICKACDGPAVVRVMYGTVSHGEFCDSCADGFIQAYEEYERGLEEWERQQDLRRHRELSR